MGTKKREKKQKCGCNSGADSVKYAVKDEGEKTLWIKCGKTAGGER